ncbi:MAG: SDR family NAD(P)-dependent oxidoreductase [Treponema sp.]|nr:SDR family NAD(P)-dependent oxidoreductase [Treponema sp.]
MVLYTMLEKYGPYALIAGASEGLGAAYAEALARRGFNLVLLARRKEKLEAFAAELGGKYPVELVTHAVDMGDLEAVKAFAGSLNVQIGLLIYNAAYAPVGLFKDLEEEQLVQIAAVNVRGPLALSRLVLPQMIERGKGGIILMSSLAGTQGSPRLAGYAASKAFNAVLAEGLWEELKPCGIDVVASCAGAILTPGYNQAHAVRAPGTLRPAQVAEKTLKALGKGPVFVPGGINKLARFFLMRLAPRKFAIKIMSANTRSLN